MLSAVYSIGFSQKEGCVRRAAQSLTANKNSKLQIIVTVQVKTGYPQRTQGTQKKLESR
jgi:hypothetical protein